jgi:hypothetical protein
VLILKKPRTEQPQEAVDIDRSNPLSRGLSVAVLPSLGDRDLISGTRALTYGTAPNRSPGSAGIAIDSTAADGGSYIEFADARLCGAEQSHYLLGELGAAGTYLGIIGACDTSNNPGVLLQQFSSTSQVYLWTGSSSGGFGNTVDFFNAGLIGVGMTAGAGGTSIFRNGAVYASGLQAPTARSTSRVLTFSELSVNTTYNTQGKWYIRLGWSRSLTTEEMQRVHANPWQLFAPRRIYIPYAAAAGGLPTLTSLGISGITTTGAVLTTNA